MGIMRKRNLFFGVVIALSLAFFYIRYNIFVTSEEKIIGEFNKYQLYIAKDVSSDISDYFNDLYSADYKIVGIEGSANLRNKETLKRMLKYLSDYYVESIALYNSSGILIATSDSSYFKGSLDNSITNSRQLPGYFVSRKINDYKESAATNYFNLIAPAGRLNKNGVAQQRPAYWIDYRINSLKFFQYQIRKNGLLNSSQTIWIIDNNGYVIFQQDHPEMTHKNFYDMNNECLNCHSSNSYLTEIKNIPEGSFKYDLKNSKGKTASFTTLNLGSYKWKIVISTESGEVSHFIIFNGIKTFLLFTVFLTILILFSFYIVKLDHKQANYGIELKHLNEKNKLLQKIAQNEERYRQLVENSPDVIGIIQDGKIVFINKAGIEIINAKYESEILGKDYNSFLTLAGLADSAEKMKTIFSYSSPQVYEAVIRSIDGELISVEVISLSIMYKEKPAVQFMAKNITERKQAEEKINLLAQAIKSTGEGISITDLDNNILYVNDSFLSMFGYREEELIGRHISIVRSENNPEPFIEEVRISTIKRGWSGELINKKKDGTEFPIYLNTSSVIDEQGKPYALVGITRDITERKLAEEKLMAYRENLENLVNERTRELNITNLKLQQEIRKQKEFEMILKESLDKEKELNELKTRFISTTSHEFRTPLTSILSSAELIQRYESKWSREKINEHLNRIKYSVDYLTGLLDDILTISRTETGKIKYEPQTTDLYLLCEESIQHAKVHSSMMHKFIFNYGLKDRLFNLDSKLIKYILINLLSNAFKYSPGGGMVELGVSEEDSRLIFKIRDEGIGIPEADMKYLFEPFHRGANVNNIPGTGLGLSIVKKAVEFHLGKINCETTENGGTNFIIAIPSGRKK